MINIFNIFKKEEEPKVKWWSTVEGLEKIAPILPAKEVIPNWWKSLHRYNSDDPTEKGTVKVCPSFGEFFSKGYVVPLWCDVHLKINDSEFSYKASNDIYKFSSHIASQFLDYVPIHIRNNVSMVFKADCPWRVKTSDGYSMLQLPMYYHFDPIFEVLPGIIWTDFHYEINQQMLIKKTGDIFLKKGTPLAVYVPYKRENFSFSIEGPNEQNRELTIQNFMENHSTFRGQYKLLQIKQEKKLLENKKNKSKCPFKNFLKK